MTISKNGRAGHNLNRGSFIFYKLPAIPHLSDHKNTLLVQKHGKVLGSFTMTERVILRRPSTGNALHIVKTDLSRKRRAIIKCTNQFFLKKTGTKFEESLIHLFDAGNLEINNE